MPTPKRQRKKSTQQARQAAYAAARERKQRRRLVMVSAVLAAVLVLGLVSIVGGGGGDDDERDVATDTSTTVVVPVTVPPGQTITGETPCPAADGSSPRTTGFTNIPPLCIDPAKTYTAEVTTNKGTFTVALDAKAAPFTVNNFVVLSRYHFYDGITFHRIIQGFVAQGGDPNGDGTGGPGYKFADELPPMGAYKEGSVAMANSGVDTNGSQFFIVTGDRGAALPPQYSLFGEVTEGMDVVKAIEAAGGPDERPREKITIESVKITET